MYEHDTDSEGYNSIEFFKTQFVKDVIIIVSVILEWYSGVGLLFYEILPKSDVILERIDDYEIKLNICSEANFSRYKELTNFDWFGVSYKLIESSHASAIISSALGIGLMRLLIAEFKFPNPLQRTKRDLENTVLLSVLLCCMLLLFTMSSYTWPLAVLLGGVLAPLYLYMFLKELNKLQSALAQYSRERLVQFGNNRIEKLKLRRFKVLSNFLRIALILFVTTMLYQKINLTISLILYFGQCFFPLTYGIQYTPILHTVTQQLIRSSILHITSKAISTDTQRVDVFGPVCCVYGGECDTFDILSLQDTKFSDQIYSGSRKQINQTKLTYNHNLSWNVCSSWNIWSSHFMRFLFVTKVLWVMQNWNFLYYASASSSEILHLLPFYVTNFMHVVIKFRNTLNSLHINCRRLNCDTVFNQICPKIAKFRLFFRTKKSPKSIKPYTVNINSLTRIDKKQPLGNKN